MIFDGNPFVCWADTGLYEMIFNKIARIKKHLLKVDDLRIKFIFKFYVGARTMVRISAKVDLSVQKIRDCLWRQSLLIEIEMIDTQLNEFNLFLT